MKEIRTITLPDLSQDGLHLIYAEIGSLVLTPNDTIEESKALFNKWLEETYV